MEQTKVLKKQQIKEEQVHNIVRLKIYNTLTHRTDNNNNNK